MPGWVIRASGNADDPEVHKSLLREVRQLFRDPVYETGSSEMASTHVTAPNFHVPPPDPPAASPPAADAEAGTTETPPGPDGGQAAE